MEITERDILNLYDCIIEDHPKGGLLILCDEPRLGYYLRELKKMGYTIIGMYLSLNEYKIHINKK